MPMPPFTVFNILPLLPTIYPILPSTMVIPLRKLVVSPEGCVSQVEPLLVVLLITPSGPAP